MIGDAYADILEEPVQTFNLNDQKLFSEPEDEDGTDFKKETQKIEQKYLVNPDKSPELPLDATIEKPMLDSQLMNKCNQLLQSVNYNKLVNNFDTFSKIEEKRRSL